MTEKLRVILIIAAVLIAHVNGLQNGFVWDDEVFVVENEGIRSFSYLGDHFLRPDAHMGERSTQIWRPIRNISYTTDYLMWKLNPMGFHLVNLLLHTLCCLLLYTVAKRLINASAGFITALIFSVHPALTEAVSWIKGRDDLQAGFFWLLGILTYLLYREAPNKKKAGIFLLFLVMAFLSKEAALGLVPLCILLHFLTMRQDGLINKQSLPVSTWLAGVGITVIYVICRTAILGQVEQANWFTGDRWSTWMTMIPVFLIYLRLTVLPLGLVCDYSHIPFINNPGNITFIISLLLLVLIVVLSVRYARKYPIPILGIAWFFIGLGPVSNLVPTMQLMAERFLYIPIMGAALSAGWALDALYKQSKRCCPENTKLLQVGFICLLAAGAFLTHTRNKDWKSNQTLFESAHKEAPENVRMRSQLAIEAVNRQEHQRVVELLDGHLVPGLTTPKMIRNLGWSLSMSGERERGKEILYNLAGTIIQSTEVAAQIQEDLGHISVMEKRLPDALKHFTASAKIEPRNSIRWSNLATAQLQLGMVDEAKGSLREAINTNPHNIPAMQSLASIAWSEERWTEAATWFKKILEVNPGNSEAMHFLEQAKVNAAKNP